MMSLEQMQIAIISDTHMPRRGRALPEECVRRCRDADLIIHAGDICTLAVLDELRRLGPVTAVHGNVDDAWVRAALPAVQTVDAGGRRIVVTHDGGSRRGRLERLRHRFPEA